MCGQEAPELEASLLACLSEHPQSSSFPEDEPDEYAIYQTRWVATCRCGWLSEPLEFERGIAFHAWQAHLAEELTKVALQYVEK